MTLMWVIVGLAVALVAAIVIIIFVLKGRKKNFHLVVDDVPGGESGFIKHIAAEQAALEEKLEQHEKRNDELSQKGGKIVENMERDHEEIADADDWNDLLDNVNRIERRR